MKTTRAAFTLIELLVVIVIIGILAAIALPVFGKVMEKGKGTKDLNNMKQIGTALAILLNDDDSYLPVEVAAWANKLVEAEHLDSTKVFLSAFDGRAESSTTPFPVSFGLNANMVAERNTSKYKNTSSLVMLAPAPTPASAPGSLIFENTSASSTVTKPAPTPRLGTMSSGFVIGVLFADFHVENVQWSEYTSEATPPKIFWDIAGNDNVED